MSTIGIKVGSGLVTNGNGELNNEFILELCKQAAKLIEMGHSVFIVSSGAIASEPDKSLSDNMRAVIGQPVMINGYKFIFETFYKIKCGQVLVTDDDLKRGVLSRLLNESFRKKIILVLNANDGTDDKEIKANKECADNDVLMKNICCLLDVIVHYAIVAVGVPGFIDDKEEVIPVIRKYNAEKCKTYARGGSELGHGDKGALTKLNVCLDMAKMGINTILAPGNTDDFILRSLKRLQGFPDDNIGTIFLTED